MNNGTTYKARLKAGLTQADAAKVLGISRYAYILHETHGHDLPRGMRLEDAIERFDTRKRDAEAVMEKSQ
jgi:transcriptional regulator with XRE-family HTH domain